VLPSPARPSGGEQDRVQWRRDRPTAKPGRNCCRRCLCDLIKPVRHLRVDRGADEPAVALADGGFARRPGTSRLDHILGGDRRKAGGGKISLHGGNIVVRRRDQRCRVA
jgi:hypothetical protein